LHLPTLDEQGIDYRIPLPGAVIENDTLYANVAFPEIVQLKVFTLNGLFGRTSVVEHN